MKNNTKKVVVVVIDMNSAMRHALKMTLESQNKPNIIACKTNKMLLETTTTTTMTYIWS